MESHVAGGSPNSALRCQGQKTRSLASMEAEPVRLYFALVLSSQVAVVEVLTIASLFASLPASGRGDATATAATEKVI